MNIHGEDGHTVRDTCGHPLIQEACAECVSQAADEDTRKQRDAADVRIRRLESEIETMRNVLRAHNLLREVAEGGDHA